VLSISQHKDFLPQLIEVINRGAFPKCLKEFTLVDTDILSGAEQTNYNTILLKVPDLCPNLSILKIRILDLKNSLEILKKLKKLEELRVLHFPMDVFDPKTVDALGNLIFRLTFLQDLEILY
jgi:hypothetical protein